jgi:hypothetical protein
MPDDKFAEKSRAALAAIPKLGANKHIPPEYARDLAMWGGTVTVDRLAIPYRLELADDESHLHIRSANGVPIADVHTRFGTRECAQARGAFIVHACNTYETRDRMLDAAADYLKRCASTDPRDNVTAGEIMKCAIEISMELSGITEGEAQPLTREDVV